MLVQYAHADNHEAWPPQEPGHGRRGARPAGEAITEHHCDVEHVRPGQKLSERKHLNELPFRDPALPFDQLTARPKNCAAEAG